MIDHHVEHMAIDRPGITSGQGQEKTQHQHRRGSQNRYSERGTEFLVPDRLLGSVSGSRDRTQLRRSLLRDGSSES
jgi:hypothetical protein